MRNLTFKVFGRGASKVWIQELGQTFEREPMTPEPFPTYKLDPLEWRRMRDAQGGLCACCAKRATLEVDHDHQTGQVRGMVCKSCNIRIGVVERKKMDLEPFRTYLGRKFK